MKIKKLEQSGFILETEDGFRLAIDVGNKTPIQNLEGVTVDAMLVSHIHGDHFSPDQIKKITPKKVYLNHECIEALGEEVLPFEILEIKAGEKISIQNIEIEIFSVDHGPNISAPLAENFGFLVTIDNQKVYFAGDIFYPSGIDVTNLEVDLALLPVGTFYTFGPQEAFDFAKQFKRIGRIISMHYEKTPETRNQFLELVKNTFQAE